jgi:hypothetical protein
VVDNVVSRDGVKAMISGRLLFRQHLGQILARYCRQNGLVELSEAEMDLISTRLLAIIATRGLPRPLPPGEEGSPGELNAAEVTPLVESVLEGVNRRAALLDPIRQLVKACFHREFAICRDSYREVLPDGICRRQQLKKALGRVSGSHCVDCPYWTSLSADEHAQRLSDSWMGDMEEFERNRSVYLPADFRALRLWIHSAARSGGVAEM